MAGTPLSSYLRTEVRDIGGGRVDIALFYERFTLVIEPGKKTRTYRLPDWEATCLR
jgi:hypothetical protein